MNSIAYHLSELEIAVSPKDPRRANPTLPDECESILDLGCGIGQGLISSHLKPEMFACGVDIDHPALDYGKKISPLTHFVCARAENLPLSNRSFDMVVSRVTLPFVDIPKTLKEIARVTKDGGQVWFTFHDWFLARSGLLKAVRAGSVKNILFRLYVIVNGLCLHLIGKQFRYPLRRERCESFQTVRGIKRAMQRAGFDHIVVEQDRFLIVTAVKASSKPQKTVSQADNKRRESPIQC